MCTFRSSVQARQGFYSPFDWLFIACVSGQWRPWSEKVNVQADLGLYCLIVKKYPGTFFAVTSDISRLTLTPVWANSTDDKVVRFFSFFPEYRIHRRQFAWNVKCCFLGKIRKIFQTIVFWRFYPACKVSNCFSRILYYVWLWMMCLFI